MQLGNSGDAFKYLRTRQATEFEEFWAIALSSQLHIIDSSCLFRGTVDHCMVHPRELFRFAFKTNASSLIISHNHPSGDPKPSDADINWTQRLTIAAGVFSIPILDHIILGGNKYHSMADQDQLIFPNLDEFIDQFIGTNLFTKTSRQKHSQATGQTNLLRPGRRVDRDGRPSALRHR